MVMELNFYFSTKPMLQTPTATKKSPNTTTMQKINNLKKHFCSISQQANAPKMVKEGESLTYPNLSY
jgi:hypothetical protein